MKKIVLKILGVFTIISSGLNFVFAQDITINSPAAIVIEVSSDRVLYSKNAADRRKIASTTKLMTAMVVLDNCSIDKKTVISKKAAGVGGSEVGIKAGEEITVEALLYGLMLESGNDCAVALAECVSGNVEDFVILMNNKAKNIGAYNTNYSNPHGLDTTENYCTAQDLAKIAKETLKYPELQKIMGTKEIEIKMGKQSKYLSNTNRLLHTYEYCVGGKTGFTNGANMCLVTIAKKEDMQIITVILGGETSNERFADGKKLMDYAFGTYSMVDISEQMKWYVSIPVYKGHIQKYDKHITDNLVLPLKEGEVDNIYVKQTLLPVINAPMSKGNVLGDIAMYIDEEKIYSTEVALEQDIRKNTVLDYMLNGIRHIFDVELKLF